MIVSPSLLSADFGRLNEEIEMLNASEADWIHVDVMDGVFVPNISFGFPVMSTLKQKSYKPLDVHLMIVDPDRYVKRFKEAGADILNVHYEACTHLHRTIQSIKTWHMKAAVTLNRQTPVAVRKAVIGDLDMVLLMSVNPGYGGQKFIEHTYEKVSRLKELVEKSGSDCLIEIDGGVNAQNAVLLKNAGADAVVAGSSIFGAADPKAVIQEMKSI